MDFEELIKDAGIATNGIGAGTALPQTFGMGAHYLAELGGGASRGAASNTVLKSGLGVPPGAARAMNFAGGAASVAGMGLAGYDMYENGVGLQNSMDMGFNGLGLVGALASGPVGMVAGAASAGYATGQLLDQAFGISDGIYSAGLFGRSDEERAASLNEGAGRSDARLGWYNDQIARASVRRLNPLLDDEERAAAEADYQDLSARRRAKIERMAGSVWGD